MTCTERLALGGMILFPSLVGMMVWLLSSSHGLLVALSSALGVAVITLAAILWTVRRRARWREIAREREFDALARLGNAIDRARDINEALGLALDSLLEFTHAGAAHVWLKNPHTDQVQDQVHRGLFPETFAESSLSYLPLLSGHEMVGAKDAAEFQALKAKGFIEFANVLFPANDRTVGVLLVAARHPGELNGATRQWLTAAGRILGLAIARFQIQAELEAHDAEARRLWSAGVEVAAAPDYVSLLRTIVDRARELIGAEASALCIWDAQKHWWVVQGTSGATDAFEVKLKRLAGEDGRAVECPIIRFRYRQAHLDVPLLRDGEVVGCLCVASQQPRHYGETERALLDGIAGQAALAVGRARQLEEAGQRAATTERERLAREMHDMLAQLLGFVNFKTGTVREFLAQGRTEQAQIQLEQLASLSQELYADTRELILGLRIETGPEQGLIRALEEYAAHFRQLSGVDTTIEATDLADVRFVPSVEMQLIRVIQEALSNVRKHADAHHAKVRVMQQGEQVAVEIQDDGQGFDPSNIARGLWPHFGLQSMRERVESIGGTFSIRSSRGQGTTITIQVPLVYRGE